MRRHNISFQRQTAIGNRNSCRSQPDLSNTLFFDADYRILPMSRKKEMPNFWLKRENCHGTPVMESDPIKILIVDDSEIYRTGLRDLINRHPGLRVVGEAACGETAIEAVKSVPADLVLLDLSLPRYTGFEVLRKIREFSDVKVLVLTIYESQEMILQARALGAQGFCVKDVSRKELFQAITEAAAGGEYVCRKCEMELPYDGVKRPPPSKS